MEAEEKAKELRDKFYWQVGYVDPHEKAKECALTCADEILSEYAVLQIETNFCFDMWKYWSAVRKEIEKL